METIPEIPTDPGNAGQTAGQIPESDRLDEIVEPLEDGGHFRQSRLFVSDGDHQKNCRLRQRRVDALRVDRHPVPILA